MTEEEIKKSHVWILFEAVYKKLSEEEKKVCIFNLYFENERLKDLMKQQNELINGTSKSKEDPIGI